MNSAETEKLPIERLDRPFDAEIRPPGSKSLTNRALLLASLARGRSIVEHALVEADDAQRMLGALRVLGVSVSQEGERVTVHGAGGRFERGGEVFLNNAGTATRFLAAAGCLASQPIAIDGNERMRQRPIGELVALLRSLGIVIDELAEPGFVPIRIHPAEIAGGAVEIGTTQSSQFLSGLMMVGPWFTRGVTLRSTGESVTSPSYLRMTADLLRRIGLEDRVRTSDDMREIAVGPGGYDGFEYSVEPDASGATYLWAAAAITPGARMLVPALDGDSLQGDARFPDLLARMGASVERTGSGTAVVGPDTLEAIDADMTDMPDAAMTLAAACCFADGVSMMRGLRTLRVKETDRIEAMRVELAKIGAKVEVFEDTGRDGGPDESIRITPPESTLASGDTVEFDTYDDHRMAMSLSLIGLRRGGVVIRDPMCARKTYPTYWDDLAKLRG